MASGPGPLSPLRCVLGPDTWGLCCVCIGWRLLFSYMAPKGAFCRYFSWKAIAWLRTIMTMGIHSVGSVYTYQVATTRMRASFECLSLEVGLFKPAVPSTRTESPCKALASA